MNMPSKCLNCGQDLNGRWCSKCGQDGERRLRSIYEVIRHWGRDLFNFEGKVIFTLWTLLKSPGHLASEYAKGRFSSQVSPTRLYLLASAAFFFSAPRLGGGLIRFDDGSVFTLGPLGWDSEYLVLLLVPIWAMILRPLLFDRVTKFEEVFVFSVHYNVCFLLFMVFLALSATLISILGMPSIALWILVIGILGPFYYLWRSLHIAYSFNGLRLFFMTVGMFVVHFGGGQMLHNWMKTGSAFGLY